MESELQELRLLDCELRQVNQQIILRFTQPTRPRSIQEVAAQMAPWAYPRREFTTIVAKDPARRSTALIFFTGVMSVMGSSFTEEKLADAQFYLQLLASALGERLEFLSETVTNRVFTGRGLRLDLAKVVATYPELVTYEPEQLNVVNFRPFEGRSITLNLWPSGSVVICGMRSCADVLETVRESERLLRLCRRAAE